MYETREKHDGTGLTEDRGMRKRMKESAYIHTYDACIHTYTHSARKNAGKQSGARSRGVYARACVNGRTDSGERGRGGVTLHPVASRHLPKEKTRPSESVTNCEERKRQGVNPKPSLRWGNRDWIKHSSG